MQTYDAFPRRPYQSQIPSMRAPHDSVVGSGTPIYDALYSEYRRLFRTLPGDRTGEETHFDVFKPWQIAPQPQQHVYSYGGRHRGNLPALPPGPSDNRMRRD